MRNRGVKKSIIIIAAMFCVCFMPFSSQAAGSTQAQGTGTVKKEVFSPENGKVGLSPLKKKIQKEIKKHKGTWSVYVKNLDTNEYLLIQNKKLPSASLIKLYTMMTVYDKASHKKFTLNKKNKRLLNRMITVSSNEACNTLTKNLSGKKLFSDGKKQINRYCRKNGYSKTSFQVPMGKSSRKNVTSARDCGYALERMYRGTCVSKAYSKEMIKLLKKQSRRTKIPAGIPKNVKTANKTGETSFAENDAAIVYSRGADYIIVVMSYNGTNSVKGIQKISKLTYQYFN